jgi:hypothetical protein
MSSNRSILDFTKLHFEPAEEGDLCTWMNNAHLYRRSVLDTEANNWKETRDKTNVIFLALFAAAIYWYRAR